MNNNTIWRWLSFSESFYSTIQYGVCFLLVKVFIQQYNNGVDFLLVKVVIFTVLYNTEYGLYIDGAPLKYGMIS